MRFTVTHTTRYRYQQPAFESFAELRVWPLDGPTQRVLKRRLKLSPQVPVDSYEDYFGNQVECFAISFRHTQLSVSSIAEVETFPGPDLSSALNTPLGDARQIFNSQLYQLYDFLQPTQRVPLYGLKLPRGNTFFRENEAIGAACLQLNHWIHQHFTYKPGATDIFTPLPEVLEHRKGVCQDFAHLMLAILRANKLPARYVSGYIEAFDPDDSENKLVGAAASHAWVEILLPGGAWWGLDPTNDQVVGERHVKVAVGRDFDDVSPMRGTYKGAQDQRLNVMVSLARKENKTRPPTGTALALH